MTYCSSFRSDFDHFEQVNLTHILKGVFINSAYESNKIKCNEAYLENVLYNEDMSLQTTVGRLHEMCSSFMLPIKEVEKNALGLCSIKCEDFDVKVEVENVGPFSFNLADDVFILPPMPCTSIDKERLKINVAFQGTFLKPLIVPKHEIANIYDDMLHFEQRKNECFTSMLYKTYGDEIHIEMINLVSLGYNFLPTGYVVAKSSHEPPSLNAVTIHPFEKFIMVLTTPMVVPYFCFARTLL